MSFMKPKIGALSPGLRKRNQQEPSAGNGRLRHDCAYVSVSQLNWDRGLYSRSNVFWDWYTLHFKLWGIRPPKRVLSRSLCAGASIRTRCFASSRLTLAKAPNAVPKAVSSRFENAPTAAANPPGGPL